ncbi:hypothetical protein V7S43_007613 [Phytophthora oleae]|uniref:Uncharacterized protein n=1 Tax=Phytophthora oleae TaxID=2107226 RepID=A0ABD3FND4_9STRA
MNAQETLVTMAVIFISVAIFSMLSGGFCKYFDMELGCRAEYNEKVAQVGHFLSSIASPAICGARSKFTSLLRVAADGNANFCAAYPLPSGRISFSTYTRVC